MGHRIAYAVVGHNEAGTLRTALGQVFDAARGDDEVWYVDSGSTDSSIEIAENAGARVLRAPLGKGRAVHAALGRCGGEFVCLVDADIIHSERNIAATLRDALEDEPADLLIGEYDEPERRRVVTPWIYRPLVSALFPEVASLQLRNPLSGFRVLRSGLDLPPIPPGYGVETHVDLVVVLDGGRVGRCRVGRFEGPLRDYANVPVIAADVAAAVLDLAVDRGRLGRAERRVWDAWVADVIDVVRDQPPAGADDAQFLADLAAVASRPLPPRRDTRVGRAARALRRWTSAREPGRLGASDRAGPTVGSPPTITGYLDSPVDHDEVRGGVVTVEGWIAPARRIDRVEITVEGQAAERARLFARSRPDVVEHLGDPTAAMAAFWHVVDLGDRSAGSRLRLSVDVVHAGGRTRLAEREVVVGSADPETTDDADRAWLVALRARASIAVGPRVPAEGLNLLVVTHDLGVGGAQLWLWEILRRLVTEPDVACTVVAPDDGPLRRELEAVGARVHLCGEVPAGAPAYESMVRELAQVAGAERCNVALVNTLGAFVGVDVAEVCGIPAVLAVHEHYPLAVFLATAFDSVVDSHVAGRARASLGMAKAVCFVSDATSRLHGADSGIAPERNLRIDYGIDLLALHDQRQAIDRAALRELHGFATGSVVVLCVGTVEPRKAQTSLLLAFDRVADDHPDAQLVVVGMHDSAYGRGLVELTRALGREGQVRLVDLTPDVTSWYAMADALVLASDAESLPRVILEAMALGVPVLSTDVAGVSELVDDGATGLLCEARDVSALEHGLRRMLEMSGEQRHALAERAVGLIGADRDIGSYTAVFAALLRGLAADPDRSPRALLPA
jgi:D-inositol-3-phosphate glycosyltransferase